MDLTELSVDSVSKIVYYCDDLATLDKLDNEIRSRDFQDIRVFFSSRDLLEVTNINANKYNAIKNIAFLESISLCNVLAFGDNNNDYEMLKNLGKGVLMKNANEFLKINLANNEITRFSNNEDGVAKFLIDFFELDINYKSFVSGMFNAEETPVIIPNTEVKLLFADGTASSRESKLLPGFLFYTLNLEFIF